MAATNDQGIFLRDSKGDLYFLRPELLAMAKVPENEKSEVEKKLKEKGEDVAGFALNAYSSLNQVSVLGSVNLSSTSIAPAKLNLGNAASTTMCPW